jgi:hypothetical protein
MDNILLGSSSSSVNTVNRLWARKLEDLEFNCQQEEAFISFPSLPTQHPKGSFLMDKVDRAVADHSCLHNAKFKNAWCYTSIPPHAQSVMPNKAGG